MIFRPLLLVLGSLCLIGGCSEAAPVRVATIAETSKILAQLVPKEPKGLFCVASELRRPLDDWRENEAHFAEQRKAQSWWQKTRHWLVLALFSAEPSQTTPQWYQWSDRVMGDQGLPISKQDAARLDTSLERALKSNLPNQSRRVSFAHGVAPCSKSDLERDPRDGHDPIAMFYSQPVLVGNVAFVEVGSVSGLMSGNGNLTARLSRDGKWVAFAERATWIS